MTTEHNPCVHEADIAELKARVQHKKQEIEDIEDRLDLFSQKLDNLIEHLNRVELQLTETMSIARTYKSVIYLLVSIFGASGVLFIIKTVAILLN